MLEELKEQVYLANLELKRSGLVIFSWGNVSGIDDSRTLVAIKPSGVPYETLRAEDIVITDLEGKVVEGRLRPSSDLATHLLLYRHFHTVKGVVHTHSRAATAFAQAGRPIPCLGTTHADYFNGAVPVTKQPAKSLVEGDYESNTGWEIIRAMTDQNVNPEEVPACLSTCHGPFVWGTSPAKAVENAAVLEEVAQMALATRELNPGVKPIKQFLLDKHYRRRHGRTAYYGQ